MTLKGQVQFHLLRKQNFWLNYKYTNLCLNLPVAYVSSVSLRNFCVEIKETVPLI